MIPRGSERSRALAKDITIYTVPTCPWCRQAKEYLAQNGVEYTDYNVAEDQTKFQEMVKLSGQMSVPVIVIDGEMQLGFNEKKLAAALGK
jgi:glutaredoxin-like YruB-family protein